jgi:hypothetical protein
MRYGQEERGVILVWALYRGFGQCPLGAISGEEGPVSFDCAGLFKPLVDIAV